jgi:replication initiation protein RepC
MQLASSGGRRLRHAALAAKKFVLEAGRTITRKELSAAAREAEKALGLSAPQRLVLSQLVACWGEQATDRLLVWPSNQRLVATTGLSERAIRNAIRVLIELQLLAPKDSPNGKRYAVRNSTGQVIDAFGFDLTPVYARRFEWTATVSEQRRRKEHLKRLFDEITICRRAAEEVLSALAHHYPAIDRSEIEHCLTTLKARSPKRSGASLPEGLTEAWQELRQLAEDVFYQAGCGGTKCRQIEPEKGSLSETCNKASQVQRQNLNNLSLPTLVLEACPVVSCWAHPIRDEIDIVTAGRFLRASLGAHSSIWSEATSDIGAVSAALAVIYVLQLCDDDVSSGKHIIRNPGGYLRSVVRLIKKGELNLMSELLILRRRRMA